jgi:NAD+ diphosphatase
MTDIPPGFTGSPLDRVDHLRADPEALADLQSSLRARLLLLSGLDPVPAEDGGLSWGSLADAPADADLALLGLIDDTPRFVALTGAKAGPPRAIWPMLEHLAPADASTYAAARSLVDWHARHRFCAQCGNPTAPIRAGWARRCGSCNAEHFPRTDPVVIMLAEHQGRVLIGRQPGFPPRRYSALAGFVEVGESIEEAVARELKEEAGVRATSVRYIASQPWPFPSALMTACIALVENDALTIDTNELEDAMWVSREDVAAAMADDSAAPFIAPPHFAIAHTLFRRWLDGR